MHQFPDKGTVPKHSPLKVRSSINFPDVIPSYSINKSKSSKFQSFSDPSLFNVKLTLDEPTNTERLSVLISVFDIFCSCCVTCEVISPIENILSANPGKLKSNNTNTVRIIPPEIATLRPI